MSRLLLSAPIILGLALATRAADKPAPPDKTRADEPVAKAASPQTAARFLDAVASDWTEKRQCGSCHTNAPYLMARPAVGGKASSEEVMVRAFFEDRAANWDRGGKGDKPRWDTEVVVTGVTLAFHDAATTGKLHPMTRKALDRMWTLQTKNGAWNWLKCNWPPLEHDDYFGAVFAAVGVGVAPEGYAKEKSAEAGLAKLKGYLAKTPAPSLHHKAWLLWASRKLDGLMSEDEQRKTIAELRAKQRDDGGWSLPSLGDWKGNDGRPNDANAPSDGYGTGLVVYVLRQAGVAADDPAVAKGAAWLRSNQRVSGRWFTRSLNNDRAHYITHTGTAFALLALKACE
jgi:squalene-hopene/tetraprenyl-beta-curcumene cyclase